MNISWVLEWYEVAVELEELYDTYCSLLETTPEELENDVSLACLWLARNVLLDAMLDIVRDIYWHNLENRPIGNMEVL